MELQTHYVYLELNVRLCDVFAYLSYQFNGGEGTCYVDFGILCNGADHGKRDVIFLA